MWTIVLFIVAVLIAFALGWIAKGKYGTPAALESAVKDEAAKLKSKASG